MNEYRNKETCNSISIFAHLLDSQNNNSQHCCGLENEKKTNFLERSSHIF